MNSGRNFLKSNQPSINFRSATLHTVASPLPHRDLSRRSFIRKTAATAAGLSVAGAIPSLLAKPNKVHLPKPKNSGIEHIVVVMMENRSFDHFLGWLPGADGRQAGLTYRDKMNNPHMTHRLGPTDYQGCGFNDPDHSYDGARVEYDNGLCDGWLKAGMNDDYCIGYYTADDLDFFRGAAPAWTTCDRYFAAILAGTFPNRFYQHAAQTDRLDDSILPFSTLPTIWDRIAAAGLDGKYYYSDAPFLALWGTTYLGISHPIGDFFTDCANGTLPDVAYVDPRFLFEVEGLSNDDHPHADIRNGEAFLNSIYEAVTASPNWPSTVLVINYDEWGGFFEHVPPTTAPIPPADAALGSDGRRGFRVPALVISPWAPRRTVDHTLFDHTSILNMIEWRFGLDALTVRDASANNLAEALEFSGNPHKRLEVPHFNVPAGDFGGACPIITGAQNDNMLALLEMAGELGFKVGV